MRKLKVEVIIVLVLLIGALSAFLFSRNLKQTDLNAIGVYWSNGVDYVIEEDMPLIINENNVLEIKDQNITLGSMPIYMNNGRVMLTSNVSFYNPCALDGLKVKKMPVTTELSRNGNEVTVSLNLNSKSETNGFIYDGNKTYVLLEKMVISYDGKEVTLPAFSYVKVENRNWVMMFNSETEEFVKDNLTNAVIAKNIKNEYKINMCNDVISYGGNEYLMTTNVEVLKNYFD